MRLIFSCNVFLLQRNLKIMISMGLSAKQEKDDRFQQIKKEVVEMIKMQVPSMESKVYFSYHCYLFRIKIKYFDVSYFQFSIHSVVTCLAGSCSSFLVPPYGSNIFALVDASFYGFNSFEFYMQIFILAWLLTDESFTWKGISLTVICNSDTQYSFLLNFSMVAIQPDCNFSGNNGTFDQ